jgi:hypothetical protein
MDVELKPMTRQSYWQSENSYIVDDVREAKVANAERTSG